MSINTNIKNLWDTECLAYTKDLILETIAKDGRCGASTALSARQRYFYAQNISEDEAPVILEIMHNALLAQNNRIAEITVHQD